MSKIIGTSLDDTLQGTAASDIIDGRAGKDKMIGGDGADTYYVDNLGDTVIDNFSNQVQIDTVISTVALTNSFLYVENYTFNTSRALSFTADGGDNVIRGGSGNDIINAGDGQNWVFGNAGNDTLAGGSNVDNLDGGTGNDLLQGAGGMDTLTGGAGDDILESGTEDDVLNGGTGKDQMTGGTGSDTYYVDNIGDNVSEQMGGGLHDLINSTITITQLAKWVEDGHLLGSAAINLTGNDLNNWLSGNDGANVIDGGVGADDMAGGKGGDTYIVDNVLDKVTEYAGQGTDLVKSSVSFTLDDYVENLTLTGLNNISGTGNFTANKIIGNDGANVLDGGGGADILIGGKGDDSYIVDNAKDKVVETVSNAASGGHDRVWSSVDFSLAGLVNVEDLNLTGSGDIHAIGNALANFIQGNDGANLIDGGKGADQMEGYGGNDTYYIDNIGDQVFEDAGKGEDTIISSMVLNSALSNVENYTFKTGKALDFVANGLDNWIEGGSGNDHIQGNGGHDHLYGNAGNDWLEGGSANDTIDGGAGADKMQGYDDNDQYFVNNVGDLVIETSTGGTNDSVVSTISLAHLFDNVENLVLAGSGNINGAGNVLDNIIWGNNGANAIDGGAGKDEIYGQKGNDLLIGGADADTFDFNMKGTGDGHDTIKDFLKAEDILQFGGVGDVDKSGTIDFADLLLDVKSIVDHGAGKAVDVTFNNGAEITFSGCGTGNTQMLSQLVDSSHVHVG